MRQLVLLLAASVALAAAQRRVAPQYKVRDEGAEAAPGGRARIAIHPHAPGAAAPAADDSGFVHPIDFSGLLRDSVLGAETSVPAFGGPNTGGPLYAAPTAHPAIFQPSAHEFRPFGAEPQKAATEEEKGFVEPEVKFRSLFDSGAVPGAGFRVQDFLTAHASSQREVEERVNAAAEGREDEEGRGSGREREGRRRAAATEHRVYHGAEEEEEEEPEEPRGRAQRPHRPQAHRSSYSEEGERGPAQFGPSSKSPYYSSPSSRDERRPAQEPYLGPDYSKAIYEAEGEGEEEGEGSAPLKASASKGKKCKKVAKKVTPEDVGKGRLRRAVGNKAAMTCYVCEDPENGGSYESCAYGSSPKDKSYFVSRAFSSNAKGNKYRQRRYLPESPLKDAVASGTNAEESEEKSERGADGGKMAYEAVPGDSYDENFKRLFPEFTYREASASSPSVASASALTPSEEDEEEEGGEGGKGSATEERATDYGYKGPPAEFFLDTAQKKHLEKLVGEFSQKDRTACKKVMKDKMTCFQCVDEKGVQHEECMFVAKSDPKGKHLAYHELKEYRLVPEGAGGGGARGFVAASAADAFAAPASLVSPQRVPAPSAAASENRKKVATGGGEVGMVEEGEEGEEGERLSPAEAAIADGVYADETSHAFDPVRKIHLPKYMLKKSQHEAIFEEFVKASHETEE